MNTPAPTPTGGTPADAGAAGAWSLVFGEVRHRRLRPAVHAFRYRAFFIEGEVSALRGRPAGNVLFGLNRPALVAFRERDHGDGRPPAEWLGDMLAKAGLPEPATIVYRGFARMLGYAFKPVSFWFCRDPQARTYAIVAEVNNTFGERHCYLLSGPPGADLTRGAALHAHKAFHVSPFFALEGGYVFRFHGRGDDSVARIDLHDHDGPMLTTSLAGHRAGRGAADVARALFGYPLFSLMVIGRIHWQALRLWVKGIGWHRKPEPPPTFVTTAAATMRPNRRSR